MQIALPITNPFPTLPYSTRAPTIPATIMAPVFHPTTPVGTASPLLALAVDAADAEDAVAAVLVAFKLAGTVMLLVGDSTGLVTLADPVPVAAPVTAVTAEVIVELAYFNVIVLVTALGFSMPKFGEY